MNQKKIFFCLMGMVFCLFSLYAEEKLDYAVKFEGVQDKPLLHLLQSASELIKLKTHLPRNEEALRKRSEKDIPKLVRTLHSQGYYNARVSVLIEMRATLAHVVFHIEPGPLYPIVEVVVSPEIPCVNSDLSSIFLGQVATEKTIRSCGEALIQHLAELGYPLATIEDRQVIADQNNRSIRLKFHIKSGPLAFFGPVAITGLKSLYKPFVWNKVAWKYGEIYDAKKIQATLENLENTGIFRSISLTYDEDRMENEFLPISIDLSEGKMRSFGLGFGYSTQRGPGITADWEHRNYQGMGEKLGFNLNALLDTQETSLSYIIPDFLARRQDLIYVAEIGHDITKGYEKTSFAISSTIERWISDHSIVAFGAMYEYLKSSKEKDSGKRETETYHLMRLPLKWRWSNVDDFLDPKSGTLLFFKIMPTLQALDDPFLYTVTTLTASMYQPLSKEQNSIFAAKIHLGSIWGTARGTIPGSERFNAGSENLLRGYNYHTVSEISEDGDPIGGRSIVVYSIEMRRQVSEKWGGVLFYDIGNVFSDPMPKLNKKLLQSTGLGIRYYTPVGPLRLDIAYPINRRLVNDKKKNKKHYIDKPYQIYFSVGQSF